MFKNIVILSILLILYSCSEKKDIQNIDIQGHRGARGLLPENTMPAFEKAIALGVTTLELDLAITADSQIIVSHEPYFAHTICLDSSGQKISEADEKQFNIFTMTYHEVSRFDCGSLGNPRFPDQEKMKVPKPLLKQVFEMAEAKSNQTIKYNIELKSSPQGDSVYHPLPSDFSDMIYRLINNYIPWERITIQSFDFRILKYFNRNYPEVRLAALVENDGSTEENLERLGFYPTIYSPYFKLINQQDINSLHEKDILVIPWTLNDKEDMVNYINWGVDGVITDYPDRALSIIKNN
ncbi:MAG TPA: glycerophosphodiester phosphodiesterase family protein [Cyclobacteriaceae bacterium]